MSFFGFDTTLPSEHNTRAPGFSQQYDAFAGLAGRGLEGNDQG